MYHVLAGFGLIALAVLIFSLAFYELVEETYKRVLSILDAATMLAITAIVVLTCTAIGYKGYELTREDVVRYQEHRYKECRYTRYNYRMEPHNQ